MHYFQSLVTDKLSLFFIFPQELSYTIVWHCCVIWRKHLHCLLYRGNDLLYQLRKNIPKYHYGDNGRREFDGSCSNPLATWSGLLPGSPDSAAGESLSRCRRRTARLSTLCLFCCCQVGMYCWLCIVFRLCKLALY